MSENIFDLVYRIAVLNNNCVFDCDLEIIAERYNVDMNLLIGFCASEKITVKSIDSLSDKAERTKVSAGFPIRKESICKYYKQELEEVS